MADFNYDPETGRPVESQQTNSYQSGGASRGYYDTQIPVYGTSGDNGTPKKEKKRHSAGMIALCVVLSFLCGFGGAFAAIAVNKSSGSGDVVLQSVDKNQNLAASDVSGSYSGVVSATKDSVVEITTEVTSFSNFFGQYVTEGAGSGVIISADGYIITNNHVVSGANNINVTTPAGDKYTATLVGTDTQSDIAVVKIDASGLTPATIGDSDDLSVGDAILAIGNPLGSLGGTVTEGIISALDREITVENQNMTLLQISASVNPGNSGGGLFNMYGELVGIVNAKSSGEDVEGLGFAIPVNDAITVATEIIDNGYVTGRPVLGINVIDVDSSSAYQYGLSRTGVYIQSVNSGSGAEKAGLAAGDYIVSVNGTAISESTEVRSIVQALNVGDVVEIQVIRDSKTLTFEVTLGESTPE
ncbi:MAG: trypsin-like peptidase domain-containing protein [Oscillospiraceae bacterium]|nr:trypsin-like peptidase domain-containing protein [Oscillospiraceae bacterium]